MEKPEFLPMRVLARANSETAARCSAQSFTNSPGEFVIEEADIWSPAGAKDAGIESDFDIGGRFSAMQVFALQYIGEPTIERHLPIRRFSGPSKM